MTDQYERLDQKPYESLYLHAETIIDHPVRQVWPHALKIGSWMSAHDLLTLDGKAGEVGHFERVLPKKLAPGTPPPHYHLYGVAEIIPHKLIALEVLPEKGGSYGKTRSYMSFDSILLTDMGERTHLTFLMIDVYAGRGEPDFRAKRTEELKHARALLEQYFENLRRLVQESA